MPPKISHLLSLVWAIEPAYASAQLAMINKLIAGDFEKRDFSKERAEYRVKYISAEVGSPSYDNQYSNEPTEGSTAIIPLKGALTKEDQFCGPVGTATVVSWLRQSADNSKIKSIILDVDSPGGSIDGTMDLFNAVSEVNKVKPVVAFVNGCAASAAYWAISGASLIVVGNETTTLGSIGSMSTIFDFSEQLKMDGIKVITTYAPQSTRKNEEFEEAIKGNDKPLLKKLSELNTVFTSTVASSRTLSEDEGILAGATYIGKTAIAVGLADEIGNMNYAISRANELANAQKSPLIKSNMKFKFTSAFPRMSALLKLDAHQEGKEREVDFTQEKFESYEAELERLNTELASRDLKITEFEQSAAATIEANRIANEQNATLSTELEGLRTANAETAERLNTLEARIKDIKVTPVVPTATAILAKGPAEGSSKTEAELSKDEAAAKMNEFALARENNLRKKKGLAPLESLV